MNAGTRARFTSPLRYPGGKGRLTNYLKLVILKNSLVGYDYIEPYAGGAAVGLSLLYDELVSHIQINDIDRGLYAFWWSILYQTDQFIDRIEGTIPTIEEWERQRKVQFCTDSSLFDLGFSTFFLNRTNRSGIVSAGPIGGRSQRGIWRIGARYNSVELGKRVAKVARFRSRIRVSQLDAVQLLDSFDSSRERCVFYLDPPYFKKGSVLYRNAYSQDDHLQVAETVRALRQPWIVTYDDVPEISKLYSTEHVVRYSLSYSAGDKHRGNEIMFTSSGLRQPDVDNPMRVTSAEVFDARLALHRGVGAASI